MDASDVEHGDDLSQSGSDASVVDGVESSLNHSITDIGVEVEVDDVEDDGSDDESDGEENGSGEEEDEEEEDDSEAEELESGSISSTRSNEEEMEGLETSFQQDSHTLSLAGADAEAEEDILDPSQVDVNLNDPLSDEEDLLGGSNDLCDNNDEANDGESQLEEVEVDEVDDDDLDGEKDDIDVEEAEKDVEDMEECDESDEGKEEDEDDDAVAASFLDEQDILEDREDDDDDDKLEDEVDKGDEQNDEDPSSDASSVVSFPTFPSSRATTPQVLFADVQSLSTSPVRKASFSFSPTRDRPLSCLGVRSSDLSFNAVEFPHTLETSVSDLPILMSTAGSSTNLDEEQSAKKEDDDVHAELRSSPIEVQAGDNETQPLASTRHTPVGDIYDLYDDERQDSPLELKQPVDQPDIGADDAEEQTVLKPRPIIAEDSSTGMSREQKRHSLPAPNQISWLKKLLPWSGFRNSQSGESLSAPVSARTSEDVELRESVVTVRLDQGAASRSSSCRDLENLGDVKLQKEAVQPSLLTEETLTDIRLSVGMPSEDPEMGDEEVVTPKAAGSREDLNALEHVELLEERSMSLHIDEYGELSNMTGTQSISKNASEASESERFFTPSLSEESHSSYFSLDDMITAYSTDEIRINPVTWIPKSRTLSGISNLNTKSLKNSRRSDSFVNTPRSRLPGLKSKGSGSNGRLQATENSRSELVSEIQQKGSTPRYIGSTDSLTLLSKSVMNALELGAVPTSEDDNMDQKDIESCSLAAANEKDAAEFSKSFISSSEILKDDSVNIIAATTSVDAVGIKMAKEVVDPSMLKTVFSQLETMEKDMDSKFLPVLTRVYNERNDKRVENKQLLDQLEHLRMQAVESAHEDLSSKDDSNDTLRSSVDKLQQELLELEQQKAALQEDNESLVEAKAQAKMQLRQLTEHFDVERSSLIERALQAEERLVLLTQNQESRSVELEKVSQLEAEVERLQEKMAVNEELDRTTCFAKQLEEKEALQNQLSESLEENQRLGSQHQQEVNELCSQISTLQNARDEEQMTYAKEKESLNKIISAVTDENRELKQLQAQLEVEVHRLQLQAQDLHVARAAENIEKDEIINKLKEEIIELTEKVRDFEARGSENNALKSELNVSKDALRCVQAALVEEKSLHEAAVSRIQEVTERATYLENENDALTLNLKTSKDELQNLQQNFVEEIASYQSQLHSLTLSMQGLKENALETDELQSKLLSAQCLIEDEKSRVRYLCEEKNDISAELEKCRENLLAFANMAEELSLLRSELAKKNAVASIANTSQESLQMYQEAVEGVALESANGSQQSLATSHGSSDNICEEMHAGGSILSLEPSVCFGNTVNTRCLSSEILPTDRNLSLLNDDNIGTPSLQTVNSQQDLAPLEILPTWRTEENSELQSQLKEVETTLARVDFHRNVVEAEAKRVFQELSEERDFLVKAFDYVKHSAGHSAEISEQCSQNGEDHREVEEDAIDDELVPPLAKESTQDVNENIPPSETLHIRNLKSTITQLREYIASANSKYEIANLDLSLQKSERDSLLQLQDDRIRLLMERYDRHRDEARDTEIKMTARIYDLEAEMRKAEDMVALQKLRCEAMEKERDGDRELVKGVRDEVLKTQGELLRVQAIVETTEAEKRLLEERIIILHERLKQYDAVIKEAREAAAKLENEAFDKDGALCQAHDNLTRLERRVDSLATDLRLERQKNEELLREAEANSGLLSQQQHDLACLKAANVKADETILELNMKYEEAYRVQAVEFEQRAAVLVEANTSSLMSKIEAIEADLDVERSQSRELRESLLMTETCVSDAKNHISDLEEILETKNNELNLLREEIKTKAEELEAYKDESTDSYATVVEENQELREKSSQVSQELHSARQRVIDLENEVDGLKTELLLKENQLLPLISRVENLEELLEAATVEKSQALSRLQEMTQVTSDLEASRTQTLELQQAYIERIRELELNESQSDSTSPRQPAATAEKHEADVASLRQRCMELEKSLSETATQLKEATVAKLTLEAELSSKISAEDLLNEELAERKREIQRMAESHAEMERNLERALASKSARGSGDERALIDGKEVSASPDMISLVSGSPKATRAQRGFSIGSWMLHPKFKAAVAAAGNSGSTDSHNNQQRKKSLRHSQTLGNISGQATGDLVASFSPSPSSPLKDEDRIAQLEAFIVKLEDTLRLANSDASVALDCLTTVAVYIGIQDSHLPRPFAQGWSLTSGILSSSLPTSTIRTRAEVLAETILDKLNHQKGKIADLETLVKERDDFITDVLQAGKKIWEEKQEVTGEVGRMEVLVKRLQSVIEDSASVVGRRKLHRLVTSTLKGNRSQSSSE